jgi:hypothetical protein
MKYAIHLTVYEPGEPTFLGEYEAPTPDAALDAYAEDVGEESWASWAEAPRDEVVVIGADGSRTLR